MLYEIKSKYYILVGGNYVRVDVVPNGKDDINLQPDMNDKIERSVNVIAKPVDMNDAFKKQFMKNSKSILDSNSRYDR